MTFACLLLLRILQHCAAADGSPVGPSPAPPNVPLPWGPADCFVNPTWKSSEIITERNLVFGSAFNPATKQNETLLLDVYQPPTSDTRLKRPLAVLVHGGAFTMGSKMELPILWWGPLLAQRGYVAIGVNYRLVTAKTLKTANPGLMATEDVRAAVRFAHKMEKTWRVDTGRVVVGGDSAGAIASLYHAYVKNQSEGASGNPGYPSSINAVISLSGGLRDKLFCKKLDKNLNPSGCAIDDPLDLTNNITVGDIPAVMVHGTQDKIVPYITAVEVHNRSEQVGVRNSLLTVPNAGHVPLNFFAQPYLNQWLQFTSGALNLATAECPHDKAFLV